MSLLCKELYTIEIHASLSAQALKILHQLHSTNVQGKIGDGGAVWLEAGPFDVIMSTAASDSVLPAWIDQLKEGGRLLPLTLNGEQYLVRYTKTTQGLTREVLLAVRFVPLLSALNKD